MYSRIKNREVNALNRLNPDKLYVELKDDIRKTEPILGRKYTLTHSDISGDLFLTIGTDYAYEKITDMRDEVIAQWRMDDSLDDSLYLFVYLYVNGEFDPASSATREAIFRRELPLALEAIRYGDRYLFDAYPYLDNLLVWVYFDLGNQENCQLENWGYIGDYYN